MFEDLINSGKVEQATEEDLTEKDKLGYFLNQMGGVAFFLGATETILKHVDQASKKHKKCQMAIKFLRGAIPTIVLGKKIYNAVHNTINLGRHIKNSWELRREYSIDQLNAGDFCCNEELIVGDCLAEWLLKLPHNKNIKAITMIHLNNDKKFNEVSFVSESGHYALTLELNGKKIIFIIMANMVMGQIKLSRGVEVFYNYQEWDGVGESDSRIISIYRELVASFILDFDIKKNIIVCNGSAIESQPRINIKYPVYQCCDDMKREIKNVISRNERRTYAFIGEAGCGKTTSLLSISGNFNDFPVIMADCNDIDNVKGAYLLASSVSPCIVILEDIDQMNLSSKNSSDLGTVIRFLDSSYEYSKGVVTIMTINEPRTIHPCLMNRRGRVDRTFYFGPPNKNEEVIEVLENSLLDVEGMDMSDLDENEWQDVASLIVQKGLTHSDINEIVNYCMLNKRKEKIDQDIVMQAINAILQSIDNIKGCGCGSEIDDMPCVSLARSATFLDKM